MSNTMSVDPSKNKYDPMVQIHLRLRKSVRQKLKVRAAERETSVQTLGLEYLIFGLEHDKK